MAAASTSIINSTGRPTIVLHPPCYRDSYYRDFRDEISEFFIQYALTVSGHDNVIVFTDRESFPEYDSRLPRGVVLPSNLEDIWMRDYSPARMSQPTKFKYQPRYLRTREATVTQGALISTLKMYNIDPLFDKCSDLIVDGGNVVDNDVDAVIMTSRVASDNSGVTDVKRRLKDDLNYDHVALIDELQGDTTGHSDGMVSFIDRNVIAFSQLERQDHQRIKAQISEQLPSRFSIVDLPNNYRDEYWRGFSSACGLHVNSCVTDDFIYVPVFGKDPGNRRRGTTRVEDEAAMSVISKNTSKRPIPVDVPYTVCRMGGSVRCLSWQVNGRVADALVEAAKQFADERRQPKK